MADAVPRRSTSKKPPDTDFYQQRLKAWQPILTPGYVTVTFCAIGVLFVAIGFGLWGASDGVVEAVKQYDGDGADGDCKLNAETSSKECEVSITVDTEMAPPIYLYYQLENFYQNHRRYVKSRSDAQLRGEVLAAGKLSDCDPKVTDGDRVLSPCGLIAGSFFNGNPLTDDWTESDISWESDRESKFANPAGYDNPATRNTAEYKYLYEMYPGYPKLEEEGVTNEHFIVWMRTAALPNFRKLYARIPTGGVITAGSVVKFNVTANFRVDSFNGKKFLVLSTTSWLGGKNDFLGVAYIVVGAVCIVLGLLFWVRYKMSGRQLGDPKYLNWRR